ncbi:MAG: ABC transporter substrate-binding protein [Thermomicrobiales bacterium]
MSDQNQTTVIEQLSRRLASGAASRRTFLLRAAQAGVAIPAAAALAQVNAGSLLRVGSASAQEGKTLVVAIPQATVQLDPSIAGSNGYGDIIPVTDNVTEGLTRFKLGSAEIEPALAESWEVSEDGLTYTFKIRPNVTFHDGTPLDAKAVEANFLRQFDETNPLHDEGMVYAGVIFQDVEKIEATGDMELTITLTKPSILLPGNLAVFAAGIVSPTALEKAGKEFGQAVVGTGPFKLDAFNKDVQIDLVAFDDYWGGRPALDKVIFRTIAEDTVRLSELQTGSIDVANQIDFKDAETIAADPNLQLITGPFLNVQFLAMNQSLAPFDNVEVRKAVEHAINKQNIADAVFYGKYTLGGGPIAPPLPGYDEALADVWTYDPELSKSILADAGVEGVEFELLSRPNSVWPLIAQLVQADLAAVGITATIRTLEDAEFFKELGSGKVAAFLNDWTWDNGDPDNIISPIFASDRALLRLGYDSLPVKTLAAKGQVETDPAVRTQIYLDAAKQILDDSVMVVLGYPERGIGAQKKVQNLQVSPVGSLVLRAVDLA